MKLLFENWREYLNENAFGVQGFKAMPQAVILPTSKKRKVVVVEVPGVGPIAFYRSTGTGSPELGTKNMWLPMGGFSMRGSRASGGKPAPWLIKYPGGKIPPKGDPLYEIGIRLGKAYDKKPFPESDLLSWASSKGIPDPSKVIAMLPACKQQLAQQAGFEGPFYTIPEDVRLKINKKCKEQFINHEQYKEMIVNRWLNSVDALKPDWAQAAGAAYLSGAKNDPRGSFPVIVNRINQGSQQ